MVMRAAWGAIPARGGKHIAAQGGLAGFHVLWHGTRATTQARCTQVMIWCCTGTRGAQDPTYNCWTEKAGIYAHRRMSRHMRTHTHTCMREHAAIMLRREPLHYYELVSLPIGQA